MDIIITIIFIILVVTHWIIYHMGYDQAYKDYFGKKWEDAQIEVLEWQARKRREKALHFEHLLDEEYKLWNQE